MGSSWRATPAELEALLSLARSEAGAAFGDERLYLERFIAAARHVEVQIAADEHGAVVHLGERDCSVQRRYQKVIEEAPAPALEPRTARRDSRRRGRASHEPSVTATWARSSSSSTPRPASTTSSRSTAGSRSSIRSRRRSPAATWSRCSCAIADGEPLGFAQDDVTLDGHAVECRLNAEDVARGFMPTPGTLSLFSVPELPGLRVDTHCYPGAAIPPYYDSLMAKLIAHAADRDAALDVLIEALEDLDVEGVETNRTLLISVLGHDDFRRGAVTTGLAGTGDRMTTQRSIGVVDTTTRDGNQSLWSATGLTTPDVLAIAPAMDRVGYEALDFTSSTHMAVSVRFHREDPWERIRLVSAAMPNTPLSIITTGMRFISWVPADQDVIALAFRLVARNGIATDADRRPVQRPRPPAETRAHGAPRGDRGGGVGPHLLDQRRAHARVLRRARRRAGRLPGHGPAVPEGSRAGCSRPTRSASWPRTSSTPPAIAGSSCTATARSAWRRSCTSRA